jgi:hypothetical protein
MPKHERSSLVGTIFSRLIGLVCFLLLVWLLNYLLDYIDNSLFKQSVHFLNGNVVLLIAMAIIYAAGELFSALTFPLSLPAPVLEAVASVFLTKFIFQLLDFVGEVTKEKAFSVFGNFDEIAYVVVFVAVLAVGYLTIFMNLAKGGRKKKHKD